MNEDKNEVLNESADLIFHLMILLKKLDLNFTDVIDILYERNKKIKDWLYIIMKIVMINYKFLS
mgnify:CR=1 FL=1